MVGGQGEFKMFQVRPPAGRWTIGEWIEPPHPEPFRPPAPSPSVEPTTWAAIKAVFLP